MINFFAYHHHFIELLELKAETDLVSAFERQDSRYLDEKIKLAIFFLIQYLYVRHFKHALLLPFHPGIVGWMWMYKPMVSILMYLKRKTVLSFYLHSLCPQILEPLVQTGGTYSALHPSCCLLVPGWGVGMKVAECLWIFTEADNGWMCSESVLVVNGLGNFSQNGNIWMLLFKLGEKMGGQICRHSATVPTKNC